MTRLFCLVAVVAAGSAAPAQDAGRVRGDSPQTRTRLAEAERKLLGGQPAEAADDLLKLLDDAGDDLVSADGVTYRPARRIAQSLLTKLPADVLRTVRGRIDGPAARLLEQGRAARDRRPLRQVLDRYFVARPAEDALDLLGELSFERGEFRAAAAAWRALVPDPSADGPTFPDPKRDPAAVRARLALALIFAGDLEAAGAELAALRDKHPTAAGRLAGQTGSYVSTLTSLMKAPPRVPSDATPGGDWPTFAGSFARSGHVTDRLPRYWSSSPTWRTPIPAADGPPPGRTVPFAAPARACAFHPVVLGGTAYLADPIRVIGFDLRTGSAAIEYEHPSAGVDLALPPAGAADYTLTASDGRVYARLGRPEIPPPADPAGKGGPTSVLVGLAADPETGRLTPLWELPPPAAADGTAVAWEAAPVVANGRIYAAVSRADGTRLVHAVAAYADPPGRPLWVTDVAESPAATPRTRPEPLTLAGDVLVFCSHSGVVVAVDAFTGRPAWAHRYRPAPPAAGPGRDLCPAVYADGRVFAAPADAGAVFALDAGTGQPLWDADGLQVDQLFGVSRGRLVVTLGGPVKGIRGLDLATGASVEPGGWRTHDDPQLGSFGRGLASEELLLWPTASREGTYLLHASDGTNAGGWQTLREARGNLAYAGGVLVVATPTEVMGYVADRNYLTERQRLASARPGERAASDLALALGDAGRWREADSAWGETTAADRRIGENLTDRAERAADRGQPAEATALFRGRSRRSGVRRTAGPLGGPGDGPSTPAGSRSRAARKMDGYWPRTAGRSGCGSTPPTRPPARPPPPSACRSPVAGRRPTGPRPRRPTSPHRSRPRSRFIFRTLGAFR
jgi:outer membrane protein assembly factor BamB